MNSNLESRSPHAILAALDMSPVTEFVIAAAVDVARMSGCELRLLHVAPPDPAFVGYEAGPQSVRDTVAQQLHDEHRKLREWEQRLKGQGISASASLIQGYAAEKILAEAERLNAKMIVVGSHGRSALRNLLVGSVTNALLRQSKCPVLVVPVAR